MKWLVLTSLGDGDGDGDVGCWPWWMCGCLCACGCSGGGGWCLQVSRKEGGSLLWLGMLLLCYCYALLCCAVERWIKESFRGGNSTVK